MIRKLTLSVLAALAMTTGGAFAAGGEGGHIENIAFSFDGPFGTYDQAQLQRGLQVYTEVCSACHGLKYVPFRDLEALGYDAAQVRAYAARFDIFDPELEDTRPGLPTDHFPKSSLSNAPDLSMMAKARAGFHGPFGLGINQLFKGIGGPEYIVALLNGYTGEEKEQAGTVLYENHIFPGGLIAMSPPLSDELVEYADGHANDAHHLAVDVAAFLMWAAEPKMMARKHLGFMSVFFLGFLAVLLYLTNKRIWAPVKGRKQA
jgi:ubiquinol-cytochrome c reductase cytochrome c1 subunit